MAGNKATYDTAMKRAHDHAWTNQWDRALKEYDRALTEFPEDRAAQRKLAQCLFRLHNWNEALIAYEKLVALDPTDLFALNRLAEIFLALSEHDRATEIYFSLSDLYAHNNQFHEAIRALRDLSRATPTNIAVRKRLIEFTHVVGDKQAELSETLALSKLAFTAQEFNEAQAYAESALALDGENPEARRWLYNVRRHLAGLNKSTASLAGTDGALTAHMPSIVLTGTMALTAENEPEGAAVLIEQALKAQNQGNALEAISLYEQAVQAGTRKTSVFYAAGVLSQEAGKIDAAVSYLEVAARDPEFSISANYALGKCYSAQGDLSRAVLAFEHAIAGIEPKNLTRAEGDELIELYTAAAGANLADGNSGRASSLYSTVVTLFKERRWGHARLAELEQRADDLYKEGIANKLENLGRGSELLPSRAMSGDLSAKNAKPAKAPEAAGPAHIPQKVAPLEATRIMVESVNEDATHSLGTSTAMVTPGAAAPFSSDIPTTMIRHVGSSLRTITEYLRTDPRSVMADSEVAPGVKVSTDGSITILPSGKLLDETHTVTTLSNAALEDIEAQSITVQRLLAEAEYAVAHELWDGAIDTCMYIMELEPQYLAVHMMLGDIYLKQGKKDEALDKYKTVMDAYVARSETEFATIVCKLLLKLQPENPSLMSRLGLLLLETGQIDAAAVALLTVPEAFMSAGEPQRALDEALALRARMPNSSEVALAIGTYMMALDRPEEALLELSRALTLDPGNNSALARLYSVLASQGDDTHWDALQSMLDRLSDDKVATRIFLEELHTASRRKPVPALYYGLAVLAEKAGLADIAADALDNGLMVLRTQEGGNVEPDRLIDVLASQARANLALNAHDWGLAAQYSMRALELQGAGSDATGTEARIESPRPDYEFVRLWEPAQLYYGLAEALGSQGNWQGAEQALRELKVLMPRDASIYTRLADIHFRLGKLSQALSELNELLVIYQKAGENEKTLETLGHMARLAPNNIPVHRKLSDLYIKLGMTDPGLTEMKTLAELQLKAGQLKDAMRTYRRAGDMHYTLGHHDEAMDIYQRVVRIAPRDVDARQQLINMFVQSGRVDDAVSGERLLAELFAHEGRTEDAIAALHQLLALSPEDVPAHFMLAQQLTALGEYGQAGRLYGRLMRLEPENTRVPVLQREMVRMAKEAADEPKDSAKKSKSAASVGG